MDLGNVYVLDTLNFYPRNRHTFIPHIINVFLLLASVFFGGLGLNLVSWLIFFQNGKKEKKCVCFCVCFFGVF